MPAREHILLSDAERAALFRIPADPDELARRFTLEKPDLDRALTAPAGWRRTAGLGLLSTFNKRPFVEHQTQARTHK